MALEPLLRQHCDDIEALDEDPTNGVLTLFGLVLAILERRLRDASDRNGFVLRLSG